MPRFIAGKERKSARFRATVHSNGSVSMKLCRFWLTDGWTRKDLSSYPTTPIGNKMFRAFGFAKLVASHDGTVAKLEIPFNS